MGRRNGKALVKEIQCFQADLTAETPTAVVLTAKQR